MSRFVLKPMEFNGEDIHVKIPKGLVTEGLKMKGTKKSNTQKVLSKLQMLNITKNSKGLAVHNGNVLKGVNFDKAVYYISKGILKKNYRPFNTLLGYHS